MHRSQYSRGLTPTPALVRGSPSCNTSPRSSGRGCHQGSIYRSRGEFREPTKGEKHSGPNREPSPPGLEWAGVSWGGLQQKEGQTGNSPASFPPSNLFLASISTTRLSKQEVGSPKQETGSIKQEIGSSKQEIGNPK